MSEQGSAPETPDRIKTLRAIEEALASGVREIRIPYAEPLENFRVTRGNAADSHPATED